jgi:L-threonylcarbamoyladenylate synthase
MNQEAVGVIKSGGIVVMPTDTIYGILASALNEGAMTKLYRLRRHDTNKPFIILIGEVDDLKKFNITLTSAQKEQLEKLWPGPVSIIIGHQAFRLPASLELREFLKATGPIAAPSANLPNQPPATTAAEALTYFGNEVDLYVDGGKVVGNPSTLVSLSEDGDLTVLRGILANHGK